MWAASTIFPLIYTRIKYFFINITAYMVILFIVMIPIYLAISSIAFNTSAVLLAYLIHILLGIFGIEIISSLVSQYRYTLISFYANTVSLVLSGGIVFWVYNNFSNSSSTLFILMGLSILGFMLSTFLIFAAKALYYKYFSLTSSDPIGDMFLIIQEEEEQKIQNAKKTLLTK